MGTPRDGDSGPFDELPELPPDVRIPDDASELAKEAAQVRRELRGERVGGARAQRVFASGGFRGGGPDHGGAPATEPASLRIPLLIMTAALLTAVVSLFAAAWPGERRTSPPTATGPSRATATSPAARTVPALDLVDEHGATVPLRSLLPAAFVLDGECPCVEAILAAAPAGVTVVAVGAAGAPSPSITAVPGPVAAVRRLRDPSGGLRAFLGVPPSPPATALSSAAASPSATAAPVALVSRSGELARLVDTATPLSAYTADLALLPTR